MKYPDLNSPEYILGERIAILMDSGYDEADAERIAREQIEQDKRRGEQEGFGW